MSRSPRIAFVVVFALAVCAVPVCAVPVCAAAGPPAKDLTVTGTHRGYTNAELYVRLDDDKEMTFLVRIPGDKDAAWHKEFRVNDRITVTYHREEKEKRPVATAIRKAGPEPGR